MKLAVMQPYLFPYIGYYQLIAAVDTFVFYDDVDYIKNGWINRNRMLIGGKPKYFTIPCRKASPNRLIMDIEHAMDDRKRRKLLKKVKFTYSKAPYFDAVYPMVEKTFNDESNYISDLAIASIKNSCTYLGITPAFRKSSTAYDNAGLDRSERLIDICNQEGAATYINAIGGKKLYDKAIFKKEGITLNFLEAGIDSYEQFGKAFVPGLSMMDVMMFNSPEKIKNNLLPTYNLI